MLNMTGLEKIIEKVNNESGLRSNEIIGKAEKDCEKIFELANEKGKALVDEAVKNAEAESQNRLDMAVSGAMQKTRQAILKAKVEIINETLGKVLEKIKSLPDEKYFNLVISQAKENAFKGKCVAYLNANDLARLPGGFEERLCAALKEKGAECSLSKEAGKIESGLVLNYGDIEVNCSFEAIVDSRADELKVKISELLF